MTERKLGTSPLLGMGYHTGKAKWLNAEDIYKELAGEILMERKDKQEAKIIKLAKVRSAAIDLRHAQRNYMEARSNNAPQIVKDELGKAVEGAANLLDEAIKDSY